jgi:hypothetical protein
MATIEVPDYSDRRFKKWAKVLTKVEPEAKNGYGFHGDFVEVGRMVDLPEGAVLLVYAETGSRANHQPKVTLYRVEGGELVQYARVWSWDWAFLVREKAIELLGQKPSVPEELRNALEELVGQYGRAAVEEALRSLPAET